MFEQFLVLDFESVYASKDGYTLKKMTTEAYIRDQIGTKSDTAKLGSEWLEQRLAQLRAQLNNATQAVEEFRAKHDYRIRTRADKGADPGRQTAEGLPASLREDYTLD